MTKLLYTIYANVLIGILMCHLWALNLIGRVKELWDIPDAVTSDPIGCYEQSSVYGAIGRYLKGRAKFSDLMRYFYLAESEKAELGVDVFYMQRAAMLKAVATGTVKASDAEAYIALSSVTNYHFTMDRGDLSRQLWYSRMRSEYSVTSLINLLFDLGYLTGEESRNCLAVLADGAHRVHFTPALLLDKILVDRFTQLLQEGL
ncbi:MAG: hypothetical protein PHN51_10400 [Candidatus Nanopelagicales bacterium]|nr:hypothetical protein [Candidatus Nanopelagicales bacterium]